MMKNYIDNITSDSLTGAIMAIEGIYDAIILLNGPTGCKYYHSATSNAQMMRISKKDIYPEEWYFGQERVPCTYIDKRDYVYGSGDKVRDAIEYIKKNDEFEMLAVINAPGTSLIGDDIKGIVEEVLEDKDFVVLQTLGYSLDKVYGYNLAMKETINSLCKTPRQIKKNTVNILGVSILEKNHEGDVLELKRMLNLCGIEVNCVICDNCTTKQIKDMPSAMLNIVLHEDSGLEIAKILNEKFETPYVYENLPIGFEASEKWITKICDMLGVSPNPCLDEIQKARVRAYHHIKKINTITGLPTGSTYGIEGSYEVVNAYCRFLSGYFGMIVNSISILDEENISCRKELGEYLDIIERKNILQNSSFKNCDLVFGSGITISKLKARGEKSSFVEISLPSIGYEDVVPKTFVGCSGALLIVEKVLNGLIMKK